MFMKIAKMRENRKENKGFSLVELIIVMAIMVALIAVLAPQFVKYVQRARDSVVTDAAETVYESIKSEWALGHLTGSGTAVVNAKGEDGKLSVTLSGFGYSNADPVNGYTSDGGFIEFCGIDLGKSTKSDVSKTISVTSDGVCTMTDTPAGK